MLGRRARVAAAAAGCVAAALVLAACADAVDGSGTGANPIVSTASAPSPSVTGFPTGSPTASGSPSISVASPSISSASISSTSPTSPTGSSSGSPTGSSSGSSGGTCTGADYCDGFSDRTSGWDSTSQSDYSIGYSTRDGGSYMVQSRYDGVIYSTAPINVTTFAPDYDVRVDADASMVTPGAAPEVGLRCWGHDATNGGNAGFSAYLSRSNVSITLRTEAGKIVPLKSKAITAGLPVDGTPVHIALACVLAKNSAGTVVADIAFAVNGKLQLETTYSRVASNYKWNTGKDVGLLLGDKGARGYFDNVAATHITG